MIIESIDWDRVKHISVDDIAEGVNYNGENCRVMKITIYEEMEADPHPPDLGVYVQDGIKPKMKRG